ARQPPTSPLFPTRRSSDRSASYPGNGGFLPSQSPDTPLRVSVVTFQGSPNQVWVNQFYLDVLHRPADPTGLAFWTDVLEADVSRDRKSTRLNSSHVSISYA